MALAGKELGVGFDHYVERGTSTKPIGLVDRAMGVASGLSNLRAGLEALQEKISGGGKIVGCASTGAPSSGLIGHIDEAESRLRDCLELSNSLNEQLS